MTLKTTPWDITEYLDDEKAVAEYLEAVFHDGDAEEIRDAIRNVAKARGMTELAEATGMSRAGLYKTLSENGNPSLATISALLKALGVRLAIAPIAA